MIPTINCGCRNTTALQTHRGNFDPGAVGLSHRDSRKTRPILNTMVLNINAI